MHYAEHWIIKKKKKTPVTLVWQGSNIWQKKPQTNHYPLGERSENITFTVEIYFSAISYKVIHPTAKGIFLIINSFQEGYYISKRKFKLKLSRM